MITVTRLNGKKLTINAILIETIEEIPDTMITLTTGNKIIVLEKMIDVIHLAKIYMNHIGTIQIAVKSQDLEGS